MSAKYEVKGELGRGAMGVVYRAVQVELDREVALKVLPGDTRDADMLRRFKREVKLACSLSHPHIVHIYDGGELDGRPFYAMEIIQGEELAQVIGRGPAPFADVARWAEQGADALAYIHAQGLAHRDLKPGNLMINEAHNLVLMDFGLAKDPTGTLLTEEGAVVGTPRYIAPEGYRGQEVSTPADVYALALCLHEALIGGPWEHSRTVPELAQRVLTGPPPTLADRPEVPAWFVELQARALVTDPAQRIGAAQYRDLVKKRGRGMVTRSITRSAVFPVRSGPIAITDPKGTVPTPMGTPTQPPTRNRAAVIGLAAAVFALGLASAALWKRHRAPGGGTPDRAAPVAVELVSPTFPAHRRAKVACTGTPPDGAQLVVRAGELTLRSPAPSGVLTLPPHADCRLTLELDGRALAGPLEFKTPAVEPIPHLFVQATDVEALVDFDLERPVAVEVNVYRADGQRAAHTTQPAGELYFSHWFTGLRPETDYTIEVLTPTGWGGTAGFGFRTESLKQSVAAQETSRLIRTSPELVEYAITIANKVPDRRVVPALLAWLRSGHPSVAAQLKKVAWIAERTRQRELAGELGLHATATDEEQVARYVLHALSCTRHPDAPRYGRMFIGRWDGFDNFVNCVKCIAVNPSPEALGAVVPHLKRFRDATGAAEWLIRIDRPGARALFHRYVEGPKDGPDSMVNMGCAGLMHLHDDADVPALGALLLPGEDMRYARGLAAYALVSQGTPAAREAVRVAFEAHAEELELLWAAGRLKLPGQTARVLNTFATARGRLKRDAACVLGLLGDSSAGPALVAALKDPAPEVAECAAWALGRIGDLSAVRPLCKRALAPGAGDAAVFALGTLASPDARAALGKLADDPVIAGDRSRAQLLEWARRRVSGERPPVSAELPLFASSAYDRANLRLEAGDTVRVWVTGTWRFGGGKDEQAARTQSVGDARAAARITVGGQLLNLDNLPAPWVIQFGGDVLLSPWEYPPVHFGGLPTDEPHGFAVVHLEPQG